MLDILHAVESVLPELLPEKNAWHSLYIDYHLPFVERLWRDWFEYRIYLHRIHPCAPGKALVHAHPWPSAIRVLKGSYEMGVGYGPGLQAPPIATRLILGPDSEYEMVDPDGWHYVRPLGTPSYSLMVTGKPWDRPSPKSEGPLGPLSKRKRNHLFEAFGWNYRQYR
jgi:hypothetical protein